MMYMNIVVKKRKMRKKHNRAGRKVACSKRRMSYKEFSEVMEQERRKAYNAEMRALDLPFYRNVNSTQLKLFEDETEK